MRYHVRPSHLATLCDSLYNEPLDDIFQVVFGIWPDFLACKLVEVEDLAALIVETPSDLYVIFRGTEFGSRASAIRNARRELVAERTYRVHEGYRHGVDLLSEQLMPFLLERSRKPVHLCGHSAGGAEATIFGLRLVCNKLERHEGLSLKSLTTFGAPAAGDAAFGHALKQAQAWGVEITRWTSTSDPVPYLPRRGGYSHGIAETYLDRSADPIFAPWTAAKLWDGLRWRLETRDPTKWGEAHELVTYQHKLWQAGL